MNSNNSGSRFFHHFMPKTMPCIVLPSVTSPILSSSESPTSSCSDHILNLSASLSKHCPVVSKGTGVNKAAAAADDHSLLLHNSSNKCSKALCCTDISPSPESPVSSITCKESDDVDNDTIERDVVVVAAATKVDMNCNDLKAKELDGSSSPCYDGCRSESACNSGMSEPDDEDEHMSEIDVDDSCSSNDSDDDDGGIQGGASLSRQNESTIIKESKSLAFGIDRILSFSAGEDEKDQKSPKSPSVASGSCVSPPVVSNTSSKSTNSSDTSKVDKDDNSKHHHHHHHSILSKLKLCATSLAATTSENQRRSTASGLPYFHHPYGSFHHHHLNSIINPGGGIHNLNHHHNHLQQQHQHHHHHHNHQHPLSHCSECLFLRRYSSGNGNGGSSGARNGNNHSRTGNSNNNIPSSSSAAANNVATNNMQFSSSMATPCGPTSSAISASFTWMANPSIYDNSAIISPVAGYNQHVPLQPSFGISSTGFSTLATMQQCSSGGTSGRRKRSWSRAVFSNLQRKGLEKRFQLQKYITKPDRRQLAATLGLTDAQVKVWFQNRRMKWRHSKEGKVSSGTGENTAITPSSSPVTSTTSSKTDGAIKDKKC